MAVCALTAVSVLTGPPASAQVIGITGGTIRARISDADDAEWRTTVGAHITLPASSRRSVRLEAAYAQRHAFDFITAGAMGFERSSYRTDYVELPVLLSVAMLGPGPVVPSLLLGPAISLRVKCTLTTTSIDQNAFGQTVNTSEAAADCPTSFSKALQLDIRAGLAGEVTVNPRIRALLDVSYSLGLTDVFAAVDGKTRALLVRLGLGVSVG